MTIKRCWILLNRGGEPLLCTMAKTRKMAIHGLARSYRAFAKYDSATREWHPGDPDDPQDVFYFRCWAFLATPAEVKARGFTIARCSVVLDPVHPGKSTTLPPAPQP